ncbi:MAG: sialidase-1, partial [Algoriphagus sp.]
DDRMIMSIRNQRGDIRQRILAYSSDGGATWDKQYFEPSLIDPVCQGSIISLTDSNGQFILAHSNNADTENRNKLSLKLSYDQGETWPKTILIDGIENPGKSSYTAYSDLVVLKENTLGIIYEKNDYTEIVFKVIQMSF